MLKNILRALVAGVIWAATLGVAFANVTVKDSYPDVYYVKPGDTLWDISGKFLHQPWRWPEIWHSNTQIHNPHLIYPGDRISLRYVDGKPQLVVNGGDTVKLSPGVRVEDLQAPIPTIPMDAIQTFLKEALVLTAREVEEAPYILGGQNRRVIFGQGDVVHVRDPKNRWQELANTYGIYRVGHRYVDENTNEILGYEAIKIGEASVQDKNQDVVSMLVRKSEEEIRAGDKIFMVPSRELTAGLYPQAPEEKIEGEIIRLFGRLTSVARHDVVVVNRGAREGLEVGNVLETYQRGENVRDPQRAEVVRLPDTKSGLLVLFSVFEKVSFGLVMESYLPIYKSDAVRSPAE